MLHVSKNGLIKMRCLIEKNHAKEYFHVTIWSTQYR
jgi:hypothetical protein